MTVSHPHFSPPSGSGEAWILPPAGPDPIPIPPNSSPLVQGHTYLGRWHGLSSEGGTPRRVLSRRENQAQSLFVQGIPEPQDLECGPEGALGSMQASLTPLPGG